jgi:DNA polymerase III alpha subunit
MTKNGQPMLFARLEDMSVNAEILVFHDAMVKKSGHVDGGALSSKVKGRLSKKDGDSKLICYEAKQYR